MKKCTFIKNRVLLLCIGLLFSVSAFAQSFTATGTVLDDAGIPVIGASVLEFGTVNGVSTDVDGRFTINVAKEGALIEVSLIGSKTIKVPAAANMSLVLAYDTEVLDDVVVVGFGTQKKVNLTGSVGIADSETFESRPVQNASQALQGAVAGLNISSASGSLDSSPTINIRGIATIGTGSTGDPLILIDGMEGDLNSINPQDIDNISVLKDAAASSIYGSRAPFGVILVTTKKGSVGKVKVNYNNTFRFSSQIKTVSSMDSYSAALTLNDAQMAGKGTLYIQAEQLQRIKDFCDGVITTTTIPDPTNTSLWADKLGNDNCDYFDEMYKDSVFGQEHTISLNGGSEKAQVYASVNYLEQEGFFSLADDNFKRLSANLKATGKISNHFDYSYNVRFTNTNHNRPQYANNTFYSYLKAHPFLPLYDPNGYLFSQMGITVKDAGNLSTNKNLLSQQLRLVAKPLDGWNITAEVNSNIVNTRNQLQYAMLYRHDVDGVRYQLGAGNGGLQESYGGTNYLNTNIFSDYSFTVKDKNNFKVMAGFQAEKNRADAFSVERRGSYVVGMYALDLTSGIGVDGNVVAPKISGSYNNWATAGFFGRINYDYNGKYLAEVNLRYDGTSRFRADQRWALFPSFSLGWNISKENFWSGLKDKVNMLKLRASYGELGNQNTSNLYPTYQLLSIASVASKWLVDSAKLNTTATPSLLNSLMTWETVQTKNVGLDFGALDDRITGTFEWFQRKTLDMVGPAPQLPTTLGTAVPKANNTDLKTSGWEFNIKWNDVTTGGFGYTVGFNLSDSKTKILSYPNLTQTLNLNGVTGKAQNYYDGQNLGDIYGYTTIGIAKTDEEMQNHLASLPNGGQKALPYGGTQWTAGDIMYKDINGDGKIDAGSGTVGDTGDKSVIGNALPRYSFGINLSADYKGFDFRMFFQGVMKRDYCNNSVSFWGTTNGNINATYTLDQHADYFRDDASHPLGLNLDSYYPRPVLGNSKNAQAQTAYLQDASYIRLKNLQIGYTFNKKLINKIGLQNIRVYLSGENLWTGTSLIDMYDPELIDFSNLAISYPLQRVLSCGLSVNF